MKLRKLILFVICAFPIVGSAQINLVVNPSFEQYSHCPDRVDQVKYANYWNGIDTSWSPGDTSTPPLCLPEYCNSCRPGYADVTIPLSTRYNHYPRTGNGMMEMIMYYKDSYDTLSVFRRDYLQGNLRQNLIGGHLYSCFFYVSLAQVSAYACDNIGAYLDDGSIDTASICSMPQTRYHPQVYDTAIITDTLNWVKIEGTFTATGREKNITIGNFFDGPHTDTIFTYYWGWGVLFHGIYLVDDVGVIDCSNMPSAGADTLVHPGDSAHIGPYENLLPYTWYVLGSSTPIDSGGGVWVRPTVTTTYVLKQVLCGVTKYDTVTVFVVPVGINSTIRQFGDVTIFPNPASQNLTIQNADGCDVVFYDVTGRVALRSPVVSDRAVINIEQLPKGIYILQAVDNATGERITRKLIKE